MAKMYLEIELDYDSDIWHGDNQLDKDWFFDEVLDSKHLSLMEGGDIGDEIGKVKITKILHPKPQPSKTARKIEL